jgi:arylsulfatase A-like enzyme
MNPHSRRHFLKTTLGAAMAATMNPTSGQSLPDGADPEIGRSADNDDALRSACRLQRDADPRPNILLVFTDQQTASAMSCAGNRWVNTPHMDALAREGVRFVSAYCAAPICGPSRGSLVTGLPPHASGVVYNGDALPDNLPTIGSALRQAGYYTAWTGKWHLPESFLREAQDTHGFHHRPLTKDIPWVALGDQTDFLTSMDAEFFLRWEVGKQPKPWFLAVSLHNPHDICYHILEEGLHYENTEGFPPLPDNFEADPHEPAALRMRRENPTYGSEIARTKDWDHDRWRAYLQTYAHLTSQVDRAVGQVLKALDAGGWKDNTLVIFTSDHGEGIAAHRWASKLSLYEESAKVPLVISYPGHITPRVDGSPASLLDLMPTICDFAGASPPSGLPGRSLRAALEARASENPAYVVCELAADTLRPEINGRMVRSHGFKYCAFTPGEPLELLFDMTADPGETRNLAADPAFRQTLRNHRNMLAEWCQKTGDPFPVPGNPG